MKQKILLLVFLFVGLFSAENTSAQCPNSISVERISIGLVKTPVDLKYSIATGDAATVSGNLKIVRHTVGYADVIDFNNTVGFSGLGRSATVTYQLYTGYDYTATIDLGCNAVASVDFSTFNNQNINSCVVANSVNAPTVSAITLNSAHIDGYFPAHQGKAYQNMNIGYREIAKPASILTVPAGHTFDNWVATHMFPGTASDYVAYVDNPVLSSPITIVTGNTTVKGVNLNGLKPKTTYEIYLEQNLTFVQKPPHADHTLDPDVVCDAGLGNYQAEINNISPIITFTTTAPAPAPIGLTAQMQNNITGNIVYLSWVRDTGLQENYFELQYRIVGAAAWTTVSPITTLNYVTPTLVGGVNYEWQVRSVTTTAGGSVYYSPYSKGTSFYSAACRMKTATVSNVTQNAITVDWTTYTDPMGGALSPASFDLELTNASGAITSFPNISPTLLSYTFTGLSSSSSYRARIRLTCKSGTVTEWMNITDSNNPSFPTEIWTMCFYCNPAFDAGNTRATATVLPEITVTGAEGFKDRISTATDVDWYKIVAPVGARRVDLTLYLGTSDWTAYQSGCHFSKESRDYDLYLYNSAGVLISSSVTIPYYMSWNTDPQKNGWVNLDEITQNITLVTTPRTYYVRVIKKATSRFDNRECYKIVYGSSIYTLKTSSSDDSKTEITADTIDGIKLIPNPATTSFTAYFNATGANKTAITVYDLLGRIVHTEEITTTEGTNSQEINTESLANGTYIVSVQSEGESKSAKLVVSH